MAICITLCLSKWGIILVAINILNTLKLGRINNVHIELCDLHCKKENKKNKFNSSLRLEWVVILVVSFAVLFHNFKFYCASLFDILRGKHKWYTFNYGKSMIQNIKEWSHSWGIKIISWHRSFKRRKRQRSQDISLAELIQQEKCIIWDQLIQTLFVVLKLKCDCVSSLLPSNWTLELLRNKLQIRDLVWQVGKDNIFCSRKTR